MQTLVNSAYRFKYCTFANGTKEFLFGDSYPFPGLIRAGPAFNETFAFNFDESPLAFSCVAYKNGDYLLARFVTGVAFYEYINGNFIEIQSMNITNDITAIGASPCSLSTFVDSNDYLVVAIGGYAETDTSRFYYFDGATWTKSIHDPISGFVDSQTQAFYIAPYHYLLYGYDLYRWNAEVLEFTKIGSTPYNYWSYAEFENKVLLILYSTKVT